MYNTSTVGVALLQIMQDGHKELNPVLSWQKERSTEDSLHQEIGLNLLAPELFF